MQPTPCRVITLSHVLPLNQPPLGFSMPVPGEVVSDRHHIVQVFDYNRLDGMAQLVECPPPVLLDRGIRTHEFAP